MWISFVGPSCPTNKPNNHCMCTNDRINSQKSTLIAHINASSVTTYLTQSSSTLPLLLMVLQFPNLYNIDALVASSMPSVNSPPFCRLGLNMTPLASGCNVVQQQPHALVIDHCTAYLPGLRYRRSNLP